MNLKKRIQLDARDVRTLLRDLEIVVVSLDRLGSEFHGDLERLAIETNTFLLDIDAFKKLSRMRGILNEAFDSQNTKREVEHLEKWLEKVQVWPNHKKTRLRGLRP